MGGLGFRVPVVILGQWKNGNYYIVCWGYSILGLFWDSGTENGNYFLGFRGLEFGVWCVG